MKKSALAVLGLSTLLSTASIANDTYFGLGFSKAEFNDDFANTQTMNIELGQKFGDYFAIEAKLGVGTSEKQLGTGIYANLENYAGLYLKAGYPVTKNITPYILAGQSSARILITSAGVNTTLDEDDTSFGIGADIYYDENTSFNFEATRYIDTEWLEMDVISVGVTTHF